MLIRIIGAACGLVVMSVFAFSPMAAQQQEPAAAQGPQTLNLSEDQQAVIAGAQLGLMPQTLVASGYTDSEAAQCLVQLKSRHSFATLRRGQSGSTPNSNTEADSPAGSGSAGAQAERSQILAAAVPGDDPVRLARLQLCIEGVSIGLPANLAVACVSPTDRVKVSRALIAEKRATNLGRQLVQRDASILSTIRSSEAAVVAGQALRSNLAAVQARFRATIAQPNP
jgi:hypothetical protein